MTGPKLRWIVRTEDQCVASLRANGCKGIGPFCGTIGFLTEDEARTYGTLYKAKHPQDHVWMYPSFDSGRTAEAQCHVF